MADESGARHNQSIEDRNNELVNENHSEEDEYAHRDGDEGEIEREEEEEEDLMNKDSENRAAGLNQCNIDGLYCPICLDTWTNGGDHQVCCLPCGHIYGLSCIKTWIQRHESSRKCPQCKRSCSLQDIRVLYASRIVAADDKLQKKVKWLEAKCASMKKKKKKIREDTKAWLAAELEAMEVRLAAEREAREAIVEAELAAMELRLAMEQAERGTMEAIVAAELLARVVAAACSGVGRAAGR